MAQEHKLIEDSDSEKFKTALDTDCSDGWTCEWASYDKSTSKNNTGVIYSVWLHREVV